MSEASSSGSSAGAVAAVAAVAAAAAPYHGRTCLAAESGKLVCLTNKLLKLKGKFGVAGILNNLLETELTLDDVKALAWWLSSEISQKAADCSAAATPLLALIKANEAKLKTIALQNQEGSDAVAEFLTEALRIVNFATHDANNIKYFYGLMKACGLNFTSDEEAGKCLQGQSFAYLAYDVKLRKISLRL